MKPYSMPGTVWCLHIWCCTALWWQSLRSLRRYVLFTLWLTAYLFLWNSMKLDLCVVQNTGYCGTDKDQSDICPIMNTKFHPDLFS